MTKVVVVNGPNLGRLGVRQPDVYGKQDLETLRKLCTEWGHELGLDVEVRQSDDEAEMIHWMHQAADEKTPIVMNPAAFTHYSYGLADAAHMVIDEGLPLMEVHISNPSARDEFRKRSVISPVATGTITGMGILWLQAGNRSGCALVGRTLTSTFRHGFSRMPVFKASGFFVPMRTTHIPVSPDWYTVILQTYANREHGEVLGPEGVGYVQVSPPQESIQGTQWWTSYQPVSYKLDSKEGTEAEFKNMVRQCKAAGVGVIADTVINHTTGVDKTQGTGTAGSPYDNKGYFPEAGYTPSDFHAPCSIWTYRDAESVWNCQVSGLQDLDTSSPHVRDVLSDYFVKLLDYGVAGFRVDAVKHMPPEDVLAIKKLVAKKSGRSMNDIWWTQEVIGDNAEAAEIQPRNYLKTGQVNEFQYAYRLKSLFSNSLAGGSLSIKDIPQNITDSGKASVFVTNWDTERNNMTLTYKDGDAYRLANAFMLAYPYGAPNVFSGYEFHDTDSGASGATATSVPDIDCSKDSGWSCTERWPDVHGMVGWHNVAGDAPLSDWQDDGDNMIASVEGDVPSSPSTIPCAHVL